MFDKIVSAFYPESKSSKVYSEQEFRYVQPHGRPCGSPYRLRRRERAFESLTASNVWQARIGKEASLTGAFAPPTVAAVAVRNLYTVATNSRNFVILLVMFYKT